MRETARAIGVAVTCALVSSCGGRSDALIGGADSGSSGPGDNSAGGASASGSTSGGTGASGSNSGSSGDGSSGIFSGVPTNWTCLQAPVPAASSENVEVEFLFSGGGGVPGGNDGTPIPGVQVQACNALDVGCESPFSSAIANSSGVALVKVPGGFSGHYKVNASTLTPAILSRPAQLSSEYAPQSLATASLLQAAASFVGVTQDPNLSIAVVTVLDCASTPAANIVFTVPDASPGETVVYLLNNVPAQSATATALVSGTALIFNVPPGNLSVTATFAATGEAIRTVSAPALEGWVTYVDIRPDQATHPPIPR